LLRGFDGGACGGADARGLGRPAIGEAGSWVSPYSKVTRSSGKAKRCAEIWVCTVAVIGADFGAQHFRGDEAGFPKILCLPKLLLWVLPG